MVSLLGGDEKYEDLHDIPEKGSKKPEEYKRLKRLIKEIDIISKFSDGNLSPKDIKLIEQWDVDQKDIDLLQRIKIQLLDFYITAGNIPVVSLGLNEHWIVFTCGNYPFTYPSVYKVVGSGKMVEIKKWVDKNIDDEEATLHFFQKLTFESEHPAITVSHILRHIILLAPLLIPEAAHQTTEPMCDALSLLLLKLRF